MAGSGQLEETRTSTANSKSPPRSYRPELQGLRAVAAGLVVVYHVWLGRVSGGVDVFFLISGFLVTGQLVRASARGGINLRVLWGRMAKRLLPAAFVVLGATVVAVLLLLPADRWAQTMREVTAAALFMENWQLAADSTDYYAQNAQASVVQHFWSLSIQGQFYLLWPLLVGLVVMLRRSLTRVLLLVFAASFAYSVYLTAVNQPLAYFHTATRIWEFALGGLLALTTVTLVRPLRIVLGWAGLAGLLLCGMVLQVGAEFPGYLALWPTLCAAAVILAGATGSRFGADRWLSGERMRYLGDLSYALYLWHWPVLICYLVVRGQGEAGLLGGVAVIGTSLVLAALTHLFVEEPVRRSGWGARKVTVVLLVPLVIAVTTWQLTGERNVEAYAPSTDFATLDGETCSMSPGHQQLTVCFGPAEGTPAKRVVLVGDSHVQQFIAALDPIARSRNWQLIPMLKGGCPYSTKSERWPGMQECVRFNDEATEEIISLKPDFVFTLSTRNVQVGLTEETPPGFLERWRQLDAEGIPVVAVRDSPRYSFSVPECVRVHGASSPRCGAPRDQMLSEVPPYANLDVPSNVSFLDFSDQICPDEFCSPFVGDLQVNFDDNHVSARFMRELSPVLEEALDAIHSA
ncbi:acyltransferase family protein [Lentzea fradiae]|uniref:acyltransferase family protein n=1 Tax=Lentzea fradiae TaxID=200378 RepID=UPI001FE23F66|nr:acyltransferase family protein [Lentzea fradiae]